VTSKTILLNMKSLAGVISLFLLGSSQVAAVPRSITRRATSDPCTVLAASEADVQPIDGLYLLQPSLVLNCLRGLPIDYDLAANLTNYISNAVQFQTTLSYLKDPPTTYQWPATDLLGRMSTISNNVKGKKYSNQWDFELDIHNTINSARDNHLYFFSGLHSWYFVIKPSLTSISPDGVSLPQLYFSQDVLSANGSALPSPITAINGQDISTYLVNPLSASGFAQDADAQFNLAMFSPATYMGGAVGNEFQKSWVLDLNDTTTYTFANKSTIVVKNFLGTQHRLPSDYTTQQVYSDLVVRSSASGNTKLKKRSYDPNIFSIFMSTLYSYNQLGYPVPVANATDGSVSGYFLVDQPDTAVLQMKTFDPTDDWDFQITITRFLEQCRSARKTKLIVDVRGNAGGDTMLAYDAFKQIFPKQQIWHKLRMRAHPAMNALGTIITGLSTPTLQQALNQNLLTASEKQELGPAISFFNAQNTLQSPDGQPWGKWANEYGPQTFNSDKFSEYVFHDFANAAVDQLAGSIQVSGYGNNTNIAPQAFASQNITLFTDGACESSCGIFANLMINSGNVSTITIGGRPSTNKMAVIGGTQGGQLLTFGNLKNYASAAMAQESAKSLPAAEFTALQTLVQAPQVAWAAFGNGGFYDFAFNFLDNMHKDSDVPPQFNSSMSNCRMFYTAGDISNIASTWSKIASGNYTCVDGGNKPGQQNVPGQNSTVTGGEKSIGSHSKASIGGLLATVLISLFFI
jgi:hypothetical protein